MKTHCNVIQCLVTIRPCSDGFSVLRESLELPKRHFFPVNGAENHRDDTRLSTFVAFHCPFHLIAVAVIVEDTVRTDQQYDDLGVIYVVVDFRFLVPAWSNM